MIGRRGEGVLRTPEAIAVRGAQVYVGDQFSHTVQVFSESGRFEWQLGSFGTGAGQFGAVGGLALDSEGDVYVLDSTNNRIEKFGAGGQYISSWGSPGSGVGQFNFGAGRGPDMPPGGAIAITGRNVYVADTQNNRIERFSLDGAGARVLVGGGTAAGEVSGPRGLAATPNALYVTDEGNDRVQELDLQGRFLAQTGTLAAVPETFTNPFDVAVHGGQVYVADDNNGRVVELTRSLQYVSTLTGEGPSALSKFVRALAVDQAGRVLVTDTGHDRVEVFDSHGSTLSSWGTSGITPGEFIAPLGVAAGPGGRMLVAETFGSRSPLYLFSAHHGYLATWQRGGEVVLGSHWFSPNATAFAPDGSVWVTDQRNGLIRHLSPTGVFLGVLAGGSGGAYASAPGALTSHFAEPSGVAVDARGEVFVADTGHDRVQAYSPEGRLLANWSRVGSGRLREPRAVALAPSGAEIYVLDAGNERIVELGQRGQLLAAWGRSGPGAGRFERPSGIAVDSSGHVFVSDAGADSIQEFTPAGRLLSEWGAQGSGWGELSEPSGIAVGCQGDVLVADTRNNRLEIFAHAASRGSCSAPAGG